MRAEPVRDGIDWALSTGARPPQGLVRLQSDLVVPASPADTFAFFADASNLQCLTPPWLDFRIMTPLPIDMREGTRIDYRIRLYGVPIPWRSRIDVWEHGVRFVDRQLIGPYRWWHHEHRFEPVSAGTRVIDEVEFLPRLRWVTSRLVQRDVARIFAYRREKLQQLFA
jgi:ligand-binding SRPBCC domain-containing protein